MEWAPSDFSIFGDAISTTHARFGMNNPGWLTALPCQSRLYVGDGMLFDIRHPLRQRANTDTWGVDYERDLQTSFALMGSWRQRRQCLRGSPPTASTPEKRMSARIDQIASRHLADNFLRVSADATLDLVGWVSWGSRISPVWNRRVSVVRAPRRYRALPHSRV